jgi:hypothetical protein
VRKPKDISTTNFHKKKIKKMQKSQVSQFCFIVFTLIQIGIFIFSPSLYGGMMKELEGPPYFISLRLIGVKEIGLMTFYSVGVLLNDRDITWLTVCGRSTTLLFTPFSLYFFNAPKELWGGVFQDVIACSFTVYFLLTEKKGPKRQILPLNQFNSLLPRLTCFIGGVLEFIYGMSLFTDPTKQELVNFEMYGNGMNVRSFGYMVFLCGLYWCSVAILPKLDGLVYLAVGIHHISFYFCSLYGLSSLLNTPVSPRKEYLYFGLALVASVGIASILPSRKSQKSD